MLYFDLYLICIDLSKSTDNNTQVHITMKIIVNKAINKE